MSVSSANINNSAAAYTPAAQKTAAPAKPQNHGQSAPGATAKDSYTPSPEASEAAAKNNPVKGFSMDDFQLQIREQILEQVYEASKSKGGSKEATEKLAALLYEVEEGTEAAEVPEYWNAENTGQRIFDFAMSFRDLYPDMSDEEYVSQVRDAVEKGFAEAKEILGNELPGPAKQLFNDTYDHTMSLFDQWLENGKEVGTPQDEEQSVTDMIAAEEETQGSVATTHAEVAAENKRAAGLDLVA